MLLSSMCLTRMGRTNYEGGSERMIRLSHFGPEYLLYVLEAFSHSVLMSNINFMDTVRNLIRASAVGFLSNLTYED